MIVIGDIYLLTDPLNSTSYPFLLYVVKTLTCSDLAFHFSFSFFSYRLTTSVSIEIKFECAKNAPGHCSFIGDGLVVAFIVFKSFP